MDVHSALILYMYGHTCTRDFSLSSLLYLSHSLFSLGHALWACCVDISFFCTTLPYNSDDILHARLSFLEYYMNICMLANACRNAYIRCTSMQCLCIFIMLTCKSDKYKYKYIYIYVCMYVCI